MQQPPPPQAARAQSDDLQHLRILSVLHYVFGGLIALGGCFALIYVALGMAMAAQPDAFADGGEAPPPWLGGILAGFGGCMLVGSCIGAALIIYAGWCLQSLRYRTFCFVIAGVMCLSVPLGTLLGVFTIIVLARPSVAVLFAQRRAAGAAIERQL